MITHDEYYNKFYLFCDFYRVFQLVPYLIRVILEDVNHFFPSQLQEEVTELKGQSEESQIAEVNSHFLHICYISNNYRNILNIFNILNMLNI